MREVEFNSGEKVRDLKRAVDKDEQLRKACKEFESVFTNELLKSMRRTVEKCSLFHGGQGEEIYESLLDQELSKKMAGLGPQSLANVLYRQLRRESVEGSTEGPNLKEWGKRPAPAVLNPLRQGQLSSPYGWRKDPINGGDQFHRGIDLAAPEGTEVRAAMEGKVITSGFGEEYGNFVMLDHGSGLTTLYAHNRENKVKQGDWVQGGEPLAAVGSTGKSTGPHLHFEVRRQGTHQDPRAFLDRFSGEQVAQSGSTPRVDEKKE